MTVSRCPPLQANMRAVNPVSCKIMYIQCIRNVGNDTQCISNLLVAEGQDQHVHLTIVLPFLSCLPHNTTSEQRVPPGQMYTLHTSPLHLVKNDGMQVLTSSMWLRATSAPNSFLTIAIFLFLTASRRGVWPS